MKKIILASKSPRRKELLESIGLKFEIMDSNFDESKVEYDGTYIGLVEALAYGKAKNVSDRVGEGIIIGADTIVALEDRVYGKAKNLEDAFGMLSSLSNRTHRVITGVSIIDNYSGKVLNDYEVTEVTFNKLTEDEIMSYLKSRDYEGKAGAYGIQSKGAVLVKRIEGCYSNVVGLPLSKVCSMLKSLNESIYTHWN